MYSQTIEKLIKIFSKFPTIGPKTAARFVFYLNELSKEEINNIINSISDLKKNIKICSLCFKPFEGETKLCEICSNLSRDRTQLCVIEKETDLESIEKTKKFKGLYFILGGTVSSLKKVDIEKLRVKELESKIKNHPEIEEIILAINPTSDGEATTLYLERILKPAGKKITRLGRGLPVGGELEYADGETLSSALENRR
ncbi:recombination mediator RecR [Patescibacteria group bacterium]